MNKLCGDFFKAEKEEMMQGFFLVVTLENLVVTKIFLVVTEIYLAFT